jgi:hypothetical protein
MSQPQPILIRSAVVKIGANTVGLARGVEITEEWETVEAPVFGSETPLRAVTFKRVSFRINRLYVKNDTVLRNAYNNGAVFDLDFYPEGEGTGKEKWTVKDALLTRLVKTAEYGRFIEETAAGTGKEVQYTVIS